MVFSYTVQLEIHVLVRPFELFWKGKLCLTSLVTHRVFILFPCSLSQRDLSPQPLQTPTTPQSDLHGLTVGC